MVNVNKPKVKVLGTEPSNTGRNNCRQVLSTIPPPLRYNKRKHIDNKDWRKVIY